MQEEIRQVGLPAISAAYEKGMYGTNDFPITARKVLDRHIREQQNVPKRKSS